MPKTEKKPAMGTLTWLLAGIAAGLVTCLLLLLLCAVLISTGALSMDGSKGLALAACAVGGFAGGLLAVRRHGRRALPMGAGVGALYFVVLLLLAPLIVDDMVFGTEQLPLLFTCLCSGALAGLLGKKRKKRRL